MVSALRQRIGRRPARQLIGPTSAMRSCEAVNLTWQDFARYAFSSDGQDTTRGISDEELARAIGVTGNLLNTAVLLSEQHGRIIARTDIAARVERSPRLAELLEIAHNAHIQRAIHRGRQIIAERHQEQHQRVRLRELRRARKQGPRCGARTRTGAPCQRKPVLGKKRCPNHGGLSSGPKTPEGRARSLAALRRGRARARVIRTSPRA
jgi:hypothetical protein